MKPSASLGVASGVQWVHTGYELNCHYRETQPRILRICRLEGIFSKHSKAKTGNVKVCPNSQGDFRSFGQHLLLLLHDVTPTPTLDDLAVFSL